MGPRVVFVFCVSRIMLTSRCSCVVLSISLCCVGSWDEAKLVLYLPKKEKRTYTASRSPTLHIHAGRCVHGKVRTKRTCDQNASFFFNQTAACKVTKEHDSK